MGFFVPPKKLEENQQSKKQSDVNVEIDLIAMSKKINVTQEELKMYSVEDFLNIYNAYFGRENNESGNNEYNVISDPAGLQNFLLGGA